MSILIERSKTLAETPIDGVYVIYGDGGSGKTVLASTFPATETEKLLYLDILEGDTGSISPSKNDVIQVVEITNIPDLNSVLEDVLNGFTVDGAGSKIPVKYSTIVFSTATQLEFLLKEHLMKTGGKDTMTLKLWGDMRNGEDQLWNLCKLIHKKTSSNIVILCHKKEVNDDENPQFNKTIPSLMNAAAYSLCAKASFVWYTKVEEEKRVDPETHAVTTETVFNTYIDAHPYLLTKTRKPLELNIPQKVKNLTYPKFAKHILSKLK